MVGIDSQYSKWDRIIAWSVFFYQFVWLLLICYVGVAIWNVFSPWPQAWWGNYYFVINILVGGLLFGTVSTIWFGIGGTRDLIRMFRDLAVRERNMLDDGRVIDNVSADDVAMVEQVDHINIEEAHIEEEILREELEDEGSEKDTD